MAQYFASNGSVAQTADSPLVTLVTTNPLFIRDGDFSTFSTGTITGHQPNPASSIIRWRVGQFATLPATDDELHLRARIVLTTGGTSADRGGFCGISTAFSSDITAYNGVMRATWFSTNIGPATSFDFVASSVNGTKFTGNMLRAAGWHLNTGLNFFLDLRLDPFSQQAAQGTDGSTATVDAYELWITDIGPRPARQAILV